MPDIAATVLDLALYREAARAAKFMSDTWERVGFVECVHGEVTLDGVAVIVVVVKQPLTEMQNRCMPTAVNNIGLDIRVGPCRRRRCGRRGASTGRSPG